MLYTFVMSKQKITPQTFEKAKFYNPQDMGIAYICALVAPYVISLLLFLVCQLVISSGVPKDDVYANVAYIIFAAICSPAALAIMFFAFNKVKKVEFSAAKVKFKLSTLNLIVCFAVSLISVFGLMYLIGGVDYLLQQWGYDLQQISLPMDNFGWLVLALILMAVLPAIFEELVFRGMILNGLRKGMGDVCALIFSSLMFALIHGSIQQFIYPFLLGLVLGWLAMRTGSTFTSMLVHFLNNAIVLIINYFSVRHGLEMTVAYTNAWVWVVAVVVALVAGALLFIIEKFYFKGKNQDEPLQDEQPEQAKPKKQKTQPASIKNMPLSFWISIGVAGVLCIIGSALGFMPAA